MLRAAARVKIAVIDSGADVSAPDVADKSPHTWSVLSRSARVRDRLGHGTFVVARDGLGHQGRASPASAATRSSGRPGGRRGWLHHRRRRGRGDRLCGQARREDRQSLDRRHRDLAGRAARDPLGRAPRRPDRRGRRQRARRRQPARLPGRALQPLGSHGRGGVGLAVGATSMDGSRATSPTRAPTSRWPRPATTFFAAESADAPWPRTAPVELARVLRLGSGTSFASPEVAGVAALGGEPAPDRAAGGDGAEAERDRHDVEPGARLGPPRRCLGGRVAQQTKGEALRRARYEPRPIHSSPPW